MPRSTRRRRPPRSSRRVTGTRISTPSRRRSNGRWGPWLPRAARRGAREMEEGAETLRAAGVEPIMAEAAARRQDWSARMNLRAHFGPDGPKSYREVLAVLSGMGAGPVGDEATKTRGKP